MLKRKIVFSPEEYSVYRIDKDGKIVRLSLDSAKGLSFFGSSVYPGVGVSQEKIKIFFGNYLTFFVSLEDFWGAFEGLDSIAKKTSSDALQKGRNANAENLKRLLEAVVDHAECIVFLKE